MVNDSVFERCHIGPMRQLSAFVAPKVAAASRNFPESVVLGATLDAVLYLKGRPCSFRIPVDTENLIQGDGRVGP